MTDVRKKSKKKKIGRKGLLKMNGYFTKNFLKESNLNKVIHTNFQLDSNVI